MVKNMIGVQHGVFTAQNSVMLTAAGFSSATCNDKETQMRQDDDLGLFSGGRRAAMYADPTSADEEVALEPELREDAEEDEGHLIGREVETGPVRFDPFTNQPAGMPPLPPPLPPTVARDEARATPLQELVPTVPTETPQTPGLWQRLMIKVGATPAPPTAAELEDRENERIIRQSTWTRAMSAAVLNRKGGSAKTPMTVLLAGAIADIRGGGVVAWEAAEVPGDLSVVAEGTPPRGMTEMLAGRETISSAGTLAGYTAPQTSHAAVIGSVSDRGEITPQEVKEARDLLGTYYQIDVADTANNLKRPSLRTLLEGTDAVVIPCVVKDLSIYGLREALVAVERVPGLRDRTVLVVSHDGGPENSEMAAGITENLARHFNVKGIVELPYDPAIRADGELSYGSLQPATRLALRRIARHVIESFNSATTNTNGSE